MSQTGIAAVITMLFCAAVLVLYWKQIAALVFFAVTAVFCAGVYYIVATFYP
jgi:hypothetical protein